MDEFLSARYLTLESVSDITGSHNFNQSAIRNNNQGISHSPRKFRSSDTFAPNIPRESVQFIIRITLFVCVLISSECRLVKAYCMLEIISVARIVWPFAMDQKDIIALTFAIFANKNIIRYFSVANLLHGRD